VTVRKNIALNRVRKGNAGMVGRTSFPSTVVEDSSWSRDVVHVNLSSIAFRRNLRTGGPWKSTTTAASLEDSGSAIQSASRTRSNYIEYTVSVLLLVIFMLYLFINKCFVWKYFAQRGRGFVECRGVKKSQFLTNISLYLGNDTVTMEDEYETVSKFSNGTSSNDLDRVT